MANPVPIPLEIAEARGSRSAKPRKKLEPTISVGVPHAPKWLPEEAKKERKRVVPLLVEMGVLTKADKTSLTAYCLLWQEFADISRQIQEEGRYDPMDRTGLSAKQRLIREVYTQLRQYVTEFGLSPAARAKLQIKATKESERNNVRDRFKIR